MPRKAAAKNTRKTQQTKKPELVVASPVITPSKSTRKIKKFYIIVPLVIIIVFALLYYFRSYFVVATVNGQPISRMAFNDELQKQAGKQVLTSLVRKILIQQQADKNHISVSQSEINNEMKKIQDNLAKRGQTLDQALTMSGITKNDLMDQIRTQLILEKLFAKDITVSNKEIDDYIASQSAGSDGTPQISRDDAKQAVMQNKLNAKVNPWLSDLENKAKITYFVNL